MAIDNARLPVINTTPSATPSAPQLKRHDGWWVQPLAVFLGFTAFVIYTTWRAFENQYYYAAPYLSPFYSPNFSHAVQHWMVGPYHFSAALLILPVPLLFRGTCYYYRKAYYRSYFLDPPACAVSEPVARKNYTGERQFPWTIQNLHRYAFYLAFIVLIVLWYDAILAFDFGGHFGMGLGSLIFLINVILLSLYSFSCHSWRHLTGGCVNCFSCSSGTKTRHSIWEKVTHLNENHALWAWCSLASVLVADFYVRCLATGAIKDVRFF